MMAPLVEQQSPSVVSAMKTAETYRREVVAANKSLEAHRKTCVALRDRIRDLEQANRLLDEKCTELREKVARWEACASCDACGGNGTPISGRPCMCGGTGLASDAVCHLRDALLASERVADRLRADLARMDGPAEGFVRVRIGVDRDARAPHGMTAFLIDELSRVDEYTIAVITADVPIPRVVEVEGTVEVVR